MTRRPPLLAAGFALAAAWLVAAPLAAQDRKDTPKDPVKVPTVELTGSIGDLDLAKMAPPTRVVVTQKGWERLAEAWTIKNPPKVDFDKELLIVVTSRTTQVVVRPKLDDTTGDLKVDVLEGKDDTRGGFRWAIRSFDRTRVKTVDGKPLPTE